MNFQKTTRLFANVGQRRDRLAPVSPIAAFWPRILSLWGCSFPKVRANGPPDVTMGVNSKTARAATGNQSACVGDQREQYPHHRFAGLACSRGSASELLRAGFTPFPASGGTGWKAAGVITGAEREIIPGTSPTEHDRLLP